MFRAAPRTVEFNKLRKRLIRLTREAIDKFGMVRPGERWLVALSGGKDSYGLLALLLDLKWRGPAAGRTAGLQSRPGAAELSQAHPARVPRRAIGIAHRIEYRDTYSIVTDKLPEGATYCSLCSRLRRGHLYRIAREEGCSALVLGHHREDSLETFFMNLFHGGKLAAMPRQADERRGRRRSAAAADLLRRADLQRFAEAMAFPIIPCDLCGSQEGLERNAMKAMLDDIERRMPGRKDVMIRALGNIRPSHMLDPRLFDFAGLDGRQID